MAHFIQAKVEDSNPERASQKALRTILPISSQFSSVQSLSRVRLCDPMNRNAQLYKFVCFFLRQRAVY